MEPSSSSSISFGDRDDYPNTLAFTPSQHLRMRFRLPSFWTVREWRIVDARERRLNRQLAYFADFMTGLHPTLLHQLQDMDGELPNTLRLVLRHPHPAHIAPVQRTKSYELERGEDLLYSTLLESLLRSYTNWVFSLTVHNLREGCRKDVWWDELAHWCHLQLQDDYPDPRSQKIAFAPHLPRTYPLRSTLFTHGIVVCGAISWGDLVELGQEIGLNPANGFSKLVFMGIGPARWGLWLDTSSHITNAIRQGSIVGNLFIYRNISVAKVTVDVKANATWIVARKDRVVLPVGNSTSSQGNSQNGTTVNITFQVLNTHLPHKNRVPIVDINRRPQLMRAIEEGLFEQHTHGTAQRIIMSGHTVDSRSAAENPSTAENRSIPSGGSGVGSETTRQQNTTCSRPLAGLGDGENVLIRGVTAENTEIIGNGVDISSEDANVESLGGSCCSG